MGGKSLQGAFSGVNKLCQQCIKECKQFKNITILKCNFVSNQKRGDTLQAQESASLRGKDRVKAPKIEKAYIGMSETSKDTLPLAESGLNAVSTEGIKNA
jgi:hypothetical protein